MRAQRVRRDRQSLGRRQDVPIRTLLELATSGVNGVPYQDHSLFWPRLCAWVESGWPECAPRLSGHDLAGLKGDFGGAGRLFLLVGCGCPVARRGARGGRPLRSDTRFEMRLPFEEVQRPLIENSLGPSRPEQSGVVEAQENVPLAERKQDVRIQQADAPVG